MQWTPEAEAAIKKVPFFVRKKVRARVEAVAHQNARTLITLAEVEATQQRYLTGMQAEIKGYQLDTCFGPSGCPNAIMPDPGLVEKIETILRQADFISFLKSKGIHDLKFHHEFRVTVSDCPNACSQPQIKDIGIIAARRPGLSRILCTACEACIESCRENAITLDMETPAPVVAPRLCVSCGQCIAACPSGTLVTAAEGYRVQLGGKLGRHPRLAEELPGIHDGGAVMEIVKAAIHLYKEKNQKGERFGELLTLKDLERFTSKAP